MRSLPNVALLFDRSVDLQTSDQLQTLNPEGLAMDSNDTDDGNSPFKPGNIDAAGDYVVGKRRPPDSSKFRAGDGRQRGRRPKGTRNLKTDLGEELASKMTIKENGKMLTLSKQRAAVKVLFANALKGDIRALELVLSRHDRMFGDDDPATGSVSVAHQDIMDGYILQHIAALAGEVLGDLPEAAAETAEPDPTASEPKKPKRKKTR
jgi:hypothetical protein